MTPRRAVLAPFAALALAACGGGSPVDTGPPPDVRLDQANRAGTQALSVDMPSLAVREYKVALARAYERDDAGAIADVAYNLALAQMKAGDAKAALATVHDARGELDRRRVEIPAELFLVQAAAAYRTGDLPGAAAAAQDALGRPAKDPDTAPRAWFIRGLVAADQGNVRDARPGDRGAAACQAGRPAGRSTGAAGPRGAARQPPGRCAGAVRAVGRQPPAGARLSRHGARPVVRGRCGAALEPHREAAEFFLRAGRSSLLRGDTAAALPLLKRAEDLARQTAQAGIVEEVARLRKTAAERATRA